MRKNNLLGWGITLAVVLALGGWIWYSYATRPIYTGTAGPALTLGPSTAPLQLEEFSDFQCPACKSAEPLVEDIRQTFGDKLHLTYLNYPLLEVHPFAFQAAQAAECANDQGKFWAYHDLLFTKSPDLTHDQLVQYARDLGLKMDGTDGFSACLDSQARADAVRADMHEGDRRGVNATPTFFLNGQQVGDWSQLKSLLQAKLAGG